MLGGSADRLCTPSTSAGPFRIFAVAGFQNRANDIVYCPPIIRQPTQNVEESTAIVYFGGDVQDFPESMETNRDSRGYMKYNLENSAILLREAFPRSHIIVIRPVRMEFKTFSCFDNFVRGNNAGVPDHTPMNHALQHLEKLLQNLSQRLISIPENEILAQAAAAAAAAATAAAIAAVSVTNVTVGSVSNTAMAAPTIATSTTSSSALVTSTQSTASSDSSSSSSNSDSSQEMDIDILQVQENVTVDSDGAMIFPCSNDTTAAAPTNNIAPNSTTSNEISQASSNATNVTIHSAALETITGSSELQEKQDDTPHQQNNDDHHLNNINNSSDFSNSSSSTSTSNSNDCHHHHVHQEQSTLLQHAQLHQQNGNPLWWRENLNLDKSKLILIGFSKGCVALNQFIYEFHYLKTLTPDDSTMIRLLSRIKDMYWLDGGHGGQKNTWITSRSLLETLTRMGMNLHVHLTPYQVQDERRPWIRKEEKVFTDLLRRLGAPIKRHLHYENQTANLMTHFEVLQAFCQHIHSFQQQTHPSALPQTANEVQQHQQIQQQHNTQNRTSGENSMEEK